MDTLPLLALARSSDKLPLSMLVQGLVPSGSNDADSSGSAPPTTRRRASASTGAGSSGSTPPTMRRRARRRASTPSSDSEGYVTLNTRGNVVVRFKKQPKSRKEARESGMRIVAEYEQTLKKAKTVGKVKKTESADPNAVIETLTDGLTEPDTDPNAVIETMTERETDKTTSRQWRQRRKAVREGALVWRQVWRLVPERGDWSDSVDDEEVWSPKNDVDWN